MVVCCYPSPYHYIPRDHPRGSGSDLWWIAILVFAIFITAWGVYFLLVSLRMRGVIICGCVEETPRRTPSVPTPVSSAATAVEVEIPG